MVAMRFACLFSSFFILFASGPACALEISGLDQPESVLIDPVSGNYFISNINGTPTDKDGNGYITKISADGLVTVLKFIQGKGEDGDLSAPKGMLLHRGMLFVTDIDRVRVYDPESTEEIEVIDFSAMDVKSLNDIAVDLDENIYISDMGTDQIFRIRTRRKNAIDVFYAGEDLGGPNGLYFDERHKRLLVATMNTGKILQIDTDGTLHVLREGLKSLDGIFLDGEAGLFVSSFSEGEIYRLDDRGRGELHLFNSDITTPADIGYDSKGNNVMIPSMNDGKVFTLPID